MKYCYSTKYCKPYIYVINNGKRGVTAWKSFKSNTSVEISSGDWAHLFTTSKKCSYKSIYKLGVLTNIKKEHILKVLLGDLS